MSAESEKKNPGVSRWEEENYLKQTLAVVKSNVDNYGREVARMQGDIDEMLAHYHDNDVEVLTILNNTVTLHEHMKRALIRNEKAQSKPYFGRIIFCDESNGREESLYIGRGGISKDTTHWMVVDWRAPVANAYYENNLGKCSYTVPGGVKIKIDLKRKRTYEIENGKLLDYFDSEVIANDDLLTKYLAKNKQAVLGEIVATIQKEQNEIIRKSPYHNVIVQGVAGSGKTTVAMHRISYILYNYAERFRPDDFYIVGSNRILLNYITGVLPDLDVYGIRQMTMEQLFVRLLYEDWDENKYKIKSIEKSGKRGSIKGRSEWFRDLEEYCQKLEWDIIPRDTVLLNPRQFVEGFRNGKTGVFDETAGKITDPKSLVRLLEKEAVEDYIRQNPTISIQSKIDMLNQRLSAKIKEEFLGKGIKYTEAERKAILKAYRRRYGGKRWTPSIFEMYKDFLVKQARKGQIVDIPEEEFDVYDLSALAYLYKRVKEQEVISEAHHVVIDEAQDFGMMAYHVLKFCIYGCTYTIMGDVSQNIHFGYGLNDWEELKKLFLPDDMDSFGLLKKSYRNTVEISDFATKILHHGQFSIYPVEPIIRHGKQVQVCRLSNRQVLIPKAAEVCREWQRNGLDTIAVICRSRESAKKVSKEISNYVDVMESDLEKAEFGNGIMVLPVEYTKGLEFDAVLILNPTRKEYPVEDGHAKLLYVAATRALHELSVLYCEELTGLITDPLPEKRISIVRPAASEIYNKKEKEQRERRIPDGGKAAVRRVRPAAVSVKEVTPEAKKPFISRQLTKPSLQNLQRKEQSGGSDAGNRLAFGEKKPEMGRTRPKESGHEFGDMPATENLRPPGHGKIDLSVRWFAKQPDGLYIQSRYGTLRLCPVEDAVIRVTFAKGTQITEGVYPKIAINQANRAWFYKESGGQVELLTDDLCLQVDKRNGTICYRMRDKKLLLSERGMECRQIECGNNKDVKAWLYLEWQKKENIYGFGIKEKGGLNLRGTARYISHKEEGGELPFILSDMGYGILLAADTAICCDVPAYGSYLYMENKAYMDFYFIAGNSQKKILDAYARLCGK